MLFRTAGDTEQRSESRVFFRIELPDGYTQTLLGMFPAVPGLRWGEA